jgi:hypothetical protein
VASLDGPPPGADALAAIAAAYLLVSRRDVPAPPPAAAPRWRLAGRLAGIDADRLRTLSGTRSRWSAAGRLDA